MNNNAFTFDIETVPLSDERLALIEPDHEAPGNYRDPEKIAQAIREKSIAWKERAALSPLTGRVAMISHKRPGEDVDVTFLAFKGADDSFLDVQEATLLRQFWGKVDGALGMLLVSWNGFGFDLPFLMKRSWALKVAPSAFASQRHKWGFKPPWIDLMQEFALGSDPYCKLNTAATFFGLQPKEDLDPKLIRSTLENDPDKAYSYARRDILLTEEVGERMGVIC